MSDMPDKRPSILAAMRKLAKRLAKRLKDKRGDLPLRTFARQLGVSKSSLNTIEQANQNVTINTLEKICDRLKCNPGELLDPRDSDDSE